MYNKVYKLSLRIESGPLSFSIIPNYILWRKLYDTIFEYRGFLKMSRYTFSKGQGSIFNLFKILIHLLLISQREKFFNVIIYTQQTSS